MYYASFKKNQQTTWYVFFCDKIYQQQSYDCEIFVKTNVEKPHCDVSTGNHPKNFGDL